jgi:Flp pilus assembly protein TadG
VPNRTRSRRSGLSRRGQSLVELALILPFLLAFAGGATDMARAYQAWLTIDSAVRNAAEYVATNSANATAAAADAKRIVCLESMDAPGFTPGTVAPVNEKCVAPAVTLPAYSVVTIAAGDQMGTAHVHATLLFDTLFPYPFIPSGGWTLSADATYSVLRGR